MQYSEFLMVSQLAKCLNKLCMTFYSLRYKMNKPLISLLTTGLIFLNSGCNSPYLQKLLKDNPTWHQLNTTHKAKTLKQIHEYAGNLIEYKKDIGKDFWQSSKKTTERKIGDCEDYSIYCSQAAEHLGYPPKLLLLLDFKAKEGHIVSLLEEKSSNEIKYGAFDINNGLIKPQFDSLNNLILKLSFFPKSFKPSNYKFYKIIDLNSIPLTDWRTTSQNLYPYCMPQEAKLREEMKRK